MAEKHVYGGIATLVGVTIGAGILALPHALAQAGFLTGLVSIVVIGIAMLMLNLCLGEVTLRTHGTHQLTGYAEKYLGQTGKHLMAASMVAGIYGAIIAYTIGGGQSLAQIFGGTPPLWSALFFITGATIFYHGIDVLAASEFSMEALKLFIFIIITALLFFSGKISTTNLLVFDSNRLFAPYGVVLFAYLATTAIPEMREEMRGHFRQLKKAIIIGSLIPIIVYLLFTLTVIGASGMNTTEIATISIGHLLGPVGLVLANLFAILALFTSFIALGYGLQEMYQYDYCLTHTTSWLLTCTIPAGLIFIGITSFARTLELTGALAGGLTGVLTVLMHHRAKKCGKRKPEYTITLSWLSSCLLILMFACGAIITVKNLFF